MPSTNFVYRGCSVKIDIGARATLWDITVDVTPFDGVELFEPFGPRKLKLPKTQELDAITETLVDETCLAIDRRLVGC